MAQLPNSDFLVQLTGDYIVLFERYTERELVRVDARDKNAIARSQREIHELKELDPEDKSFAHFWFGYFYAHVGHGL